MSTIRLIYILVHVLEIWMLFVWKECPEQKQTRNDQETSLWHGRLFFCLCVCLGLDRDII